MIWKTFGKQVGRVNLWLALTVLGAVFCGSAAAQVEVGKPMSAKALAALVVEFKEVVSKNARSQNDAKLIGARWDKRKDLAGKTKADVIELLYQDVKFVIKDSGVRYQIYSIFAFYNQIPDDFQAQKSASTKAEAVKILIGQTLSAHPTVTATAALGTMPKTAENAENDASMKQDQSEMFDEALKENKKLTAAQKTFVKANYDRLGKIMDEKLIALVTANYRFEEWVAASLEKSFTEKFTLAELNELIEFFQGKEGQGSLNFVKNANFEETPAEETDRYTKADKAAFDNFIATAFGKKFIDAYLKDPDAFIEPKMKAAQTRHEQETFALFETANLNAMIEKFVAENYKK